MTLPSDEDIRAALPKALTLLPRGHGRAGTYVRVQLPVEHLLILAKDFSDGEDWTVEEVIEGLKSTARTEVEMHLRYAEVIAKAFELK